MPPLRYLRHATRQGRLRITMCHCCHIPQSASIMRFTAMDICLSQLKHTIAYVRALQYWAEKVYPQLTSSSGKECTGTLVGNGATHLFWRGRGLCDNSTVQLDVSNLAIVNRDHATRVPVELNLKHQGPPKRIHVCDPLWRPACYYGHVGHCNSRGTSYSTMGV